MGSEATLDFDRLLAPIAGDRPCGESIRNTQVFSDIRRAQTSALDKFKQGDPGAAAAYRVVLDKARDTFATQSKDLEFCRWIVEANLELHGMAGLRDGLRLLADVVDRYWDTVHPMLDGDGDDALDVRRGSINALGYRDAGMMLPNRIRLVSLASDDNGTLSWDAWHRPDTAALASDAEGAAHAAPAGAIGAIDQLLRVRADMDECIGHLDRLDQMLLARFESDGPSIEQVREAVEDCRLLVAEILKERGVGVDAGDSETAATGASSSTDRLAPAGPIRSREDALRKLNEVADYFRRAEPHSPISYLVRRAASWGNMSLEQVLSELVKDTGVRDQIGDLLGFPREHGE